MGTLLAEEFVIWLFCWERPGVSGHILAKRAKNVKLWLLFIQTISQSSEQPWDGVRSLSRLRARFLLLAMKIQILSAQGATNPQCTQSPSKSIHLLALPHVAWSTQEISADQHNARSSCCCQEQWRSASDPWISWLLPAFVETLTD